MPDVTVDLRGTAVADEQVAEGDFVGFVPLADLGTIPHSAEVDAHAGDGSDHLSFDSLFF